MDGMLSPESPWKLPWLKPVDLLTPPFPVWCSLWSEGRQAQRSLGSLVKVCLPICEGLRCSGPLCVLGASDTVDLGSGEVSGL